MTTTMAAARFYNNLSRIFTKLCLLLNSPCCWSCCSPPSPSPRHPWCLPLTRGFTRGGSMQRRWSSWVLVWLVQTSVRRWELNRETPFLCKIFVTSIPKWNFFFFREFRIVDTILWACKSLSSPQARVTSEKSLRFQSLFKEMHDRFVAVSGLILVHLKISSYSSTRNRHRIAFQPVGRLSILLRHQSPWAGQAQPPEKLELVFCSLIFS